jgi:exodeoxyribonuclease VII large subunit
MPSPTEFDDEPQMTLRFEPQRRIYSVSQLNAEIRGVFAKNFHDIWVSAEISGCKWAASGHLYFSLKDEKGQMRCVLFKGTARWLKFRPCDGMLVLARGSLDVYEQRGEYQLIVEHLEPQGAGALQLAFEQLKGKLEAEGLFAAGRKRALPKFPRRIGIVTSSSGAVIRDILHVLERRFRGLHVRVFPALVQGEGSIEQICRGINFFSVNPWADVVIIARGGGAVEDLWTFNEEAVARAIAACSVPLISAIGHETDFTIADFVADLRAPTPSAAAELVICTRESLLQQIAAAQERALRAARFQLLMGARQLQQRGLEKAENSIHRVLGRRAQQVDDLEFQIRSFPRRSLAETAKRLQESGSRLQALDLRIRFARAHSRLDAAEGRLVQVLNTVRWQAQRRHNSLEAHLTQLSPVAVLGRGYAIVQRENGQVLRAASEASLGETVHVRLSEGRLKTRVEEVQ